MARKNETEERVLSEAVRAALEGKDTQAQEPEAPQEDQMAQLEELKAMLEAKERELEAREAMMAARENKGTQAPVANNEEQKKPADPWKETRTLFVPRGRAGEQQFVYVSINGKGWKVPRGRSVEMPLPVYERLIIMLERDAAAQRYRDSVPENGEINMPASKATRA